jgi:hypothetical protein
VREWRQVAVRVRVLLAEREPVRWYRWQTAIDERTCPECGALQGHTWAEHQPTPAPPLHVNCRCRVVPDHIEWRTRLVPSWQVRLSRYPTWAWRRTGWQ